MTRKRFCYAILITLIVIGTLYYVFGTEKHALLPVPKLGEGQWRFASTSYSIGKFVVQWRGTGWQDAQLCIFHEEKPQSLAWHSVPGHGFVAAGQGECIVEESKGSFTFDENLQELYAQQSIDHIAHHDQLVISGNLVSSKSKKQVAYRLQFAAAGRYHLQFQLQVNEATCNRTYLRFASAKDEMFVGFGMQFTFMNMKGRRLPIVVMEQGIGRGAQPITWGANITAGAGGDWHTSYASVPHYITSAMRSLFLETSEYCIFDLRRSHIAELQLFASHMTGRIISGSTPLQLIGRYSDYCGRMRELPAWVHQGAIVGLQGGTARVIKIKKLLQQYQTPIAALWLQDWVGQRTTSFGKQLWWNWQLDRRHYPDWEQMLQTLRSDNIRVLLYINPFLVNVSKQQGRRNFFREAQRQGYLVKKGQGPYLIENTDFCAGLVDLTNSKGRSFLQQIMREQMLAIGASGWMADFGEALPFDAVLHSRQPQAMHNLYPELWAQVNREVVEQFPSEELFFFMRCGYTRSPRWSTGFWLGDQLVSWDRYDGIKTAVTGLLSSGISGYSINHSDIGGYTTVTHPVKNYHRSPELLMRWTELCAFTVLFRTHEGNQPQNNHQCYSSVKSLRHFSRFAKIYRAWSPYRRRLIKEAARFGHPVVRHPFLHYPQDKNFRRMDYQQFMVGEEWMVVPVLKPGIMTVFVYLPPGKWTHLWSGLTFGADDHGVHLKIEAPLGKPAVFYKSGCASGKNFRQTLIREHLLAKD